MVPLTLASCKENQEQNSLLNKMIETTVLERALLNKSDKNERLKLEKQKERPYHITLLVDDKVKDSIVNFDFLEHKETSDFSFDYRPFKKRIKQDTLSMLTTNMEIVIVKSNFNTSDAVINYGKDGLNEITINGQMPAGVDTIPKTYISDMYLNMSGRTTHIDEQYYEHLYEPDFTNANAYYYDNEIIISMHNSGGYLSYGVIIFVDRFNNIKRIVYGP